MKNVVKVLEQARQGLDVWLGYATRRAIATLSTGAYRERRRSLEALQELPLGPKDIVALLDLMDRTDVFLRRDIGDLLLQRRPKDLLGACLSRARHPKTPEGLAEVIRILGMLEDPRAVPAIIAHAQHPSVDVRVSVAEAMMHFPDEAETQDTLATLLKDEHPVVRRAAVWSLRRIGRDWANALLERHAVDESEAWIRDLLLTRT